MISTIFHALLYKPLYNALVFLTAVIPGADVGVAVIVLTIIVRAVLVPLTHKQMHTQKKMKETEAEVKEIRARNKDNRQEETRQIMELYQKHGINPLSGFALLIIQIPILLALFWVFTRGVPFTSEALYSFVHLPAHLSMNFFGLLDLSSKSIILAVLVGVSQYIQISLSMPAVPKAKPGETHDFSQQFAASMSTNMRYVMPVFIAVVTAGFPAVVGLYWLTSNLFMVGHELMVRRKAKSLVTAG